MKRVISAVSLLLAVVLMMTGCSSGSSSSAKSVGVAVVVPYVLEDGMKEFTDALKAGLPELNTEAAPMLIQSVNAGDSKNDPMTTMAAITKVTTMMMSKEIEIMICDAENAQRHGEGGNGYVPLEKVFTPEEQAELGIVPLTVSKVDADGSATGEQSEPCGISLADCEGIKDMFKMNNLGLYVVVTAQEPTNLDNIRAAIRFILAM